MSYRPVPRATDSVALESGLGEVARRRHRACCGVFLAALLLVAVAAPLYLSSAYPYMAKAVYTHLRTLRGLAERAPVPSPRTTWSSQSLIQTARWLQFHDVLSHDAAVWARAPAVSAEPRKAPEACAGPVCRPLVLIGDSITESWRHTAPAPSRPPPPPPNPRAERCSLRAEGPRTVRRPCARSAYPTRCARHWAAGAAVRTARRPLDPPVNRSSSPSLATRRSTCYGGCSTASCREGSRRTRPSSSH